MELNIIGPGMVYIDIVALAGALPRIVDLKAHSRLIALFRVHSHYVPLQ